MSLDIWEQRPEQRRIDHKDFKDIHETTYVKGTISELKPKRDEDDKPVVFESMAKVEWSGGKSDFIPIFYKPKKDYWDIETGDSGAEHIKSQEFDEDSQSYKTAWMSFRPNDEVIVYCEKGEPKAILGFYDNYPRIGENILKIQFGEVKFSVQLIPDTEVPRMEIYADDESGPDGKDLGLKNGGRELCSGSVTSPGNDKGTVVSGRVLYKGQPVHHPDSGRDEDIPDDPYIGGYGYFVGAPEGSDCICLDMRRVVLCTKDSTTTNKDIVVPLGPYLCVICFMLEENQGSTYFLEQQNCQSYYQRSDESILLDPETWIRLQSLPEGPYSWQVVEHFLDIYDVPHDENGYAEVPPCTPVTWGTLTWKIPPPAEPESIGPKEIRFFFAPYSKELHEKVAPKKADPGHWSEYAEEFAEVPLGENEIFKDKKGAEAKVFGRPHSKEELQKVGMWPPFDDA